MARLTDHQAAMLQRDVQAGGWAALSDENIELLREHAQEKAQFERASQAAIVKTALATPAGRRFVEEFLLPRTIKARMTAAEAQAVTAEAYAIAAARRDGRNSIYWAIVDALDDVTPATQQDTQPAGDAT